jgi:hypothetical protein
LVQGVRKRRGPVIGVMGGIGMGMLSAMVLAMVGQSALFE